MDIHHKAIKEDKDMPVVKFSLNDEYYKKLEEMAKEEGVSIQDCVRSKLFGIPMEYTPADAVERALKKYKKGDRFTIPELYEEDWNLPRGEAGVFCKKVFNYIIDACSDKIKYVGLVHYERHAQYEIL